MSTEINIKKKLAILEEGASITTDALSIDFVGNGVTVSNIAGNTTVNIPGGTGNTTYYLNSSIPVGSYAEFSSVATSAAEQVLPWTVDPGVTEVAYVFETPLGVPNTTQIPAGLWQFFLHFNSLTLLTSSWVITPQVFKIDLSNVETLLFTSDPIIVTNIPVFTTMYVSDGVFPATTLLTTDRLLVKISLENTGFNTQSLNFVTEGSQHYSVAFTTLNQVISGGSVTSVTGTAPIVSSGGLTPAISIAQASAIADGYLSSSDFAIFNSKQNAITLTTTGTSGAATLVGNTLNVPNYATSTGGVCGIANSSGVYTYYTTLTLAMAAATSGNTITFFTDITETSNVEITLKDGVDINFNGYTYTLNTSGTANCFLANIANGRTRFYNGKIQRLGGTASTANSCIILINNAASAVYNLDFNSVEIYSSFGVGTSQVNNTAPKINGIKIRTFSVGCNGGQISNSYIETFGGGNGCSVSLITNCYVITTGGGHAIAFPGSGRASHCYASVSGVGSGRAISCVYGVTVTNCTAISTRNSAVYNLGATSVFTYAYSTAGSGFEAGSSTRGSVTNCFAYATAGNAYLYNDEVTNCYGESTSANAVNCFPAGNVYNSTMRASAAIVGAAINRCIGSTFISTYNNAAGHAFAPYASALISNNTFIVANTGANCIYSAGAISVKYANNTFIGSTTGVNANVSQSVTNTTDSQGNILM
jgi:hypothetical protein